MFYESIIRKLNNADIKYAVVGLEEIYLVVDSPVNYIGAKKIIIRVRDTIYPVISKDDLIKMKQKSNRAQDLEDIRKRKILQDIEMQDQNKR